MTETVTVERPPFAHVVAALVLAAAGYWQLANWFAAAVLWLLS